MIFSDILTKKIVQQVLFADKFFLREISRQERRRLRRVWFRDFSQSVFSLPRIASDEIVFFRSLVRDDYKEMMEAVIQASGVKNPVVIEDYKNRPTPARLNHQASRFMLENQGLYDLIDESDALTRSILFIRLCMYGLILEHFAKNLPKVIVFFADMQPTEHLLSWYLRQQGVVTVTMQHGLYVDYTGYETVNCINYEHQPSEYFLSWGPNTSKLIARWHPQSKVRECGKPLVFGADLAEGSVQNERPYISLLLDQKPFHQQNEEMIEIARSYAAANGLDVRVRFHPSLPKAEILKKYPGMSEQLHFTDAKVVLGHTSSLLYEALALGCRVLRYASDVPAISLPVSCEFSTLNELEDCMATAQPEGLAARYFTAIGEEALENYRAFFDDLLSERQSAPLSVVASS